MGKYAAHPSWGFQILKTKKLNLNSSDPRDKPFRGKRNKKMQKINYNLINLVGL
ncbi:MAG: hypothetical protein CM15mP32_6220 [Flavobacteriaceae bacterium]|nr:MAG: hypothetical protein CM15mP32_6220 [Flavobacteriaceae bacterium]